MGDTRKSRSAAIAAFEAQISKALPEDYRNFLISWDGGDLNERFFRTKDSGDEVWELCEIYSIAATGKTASLQGNWDPKHLDDMADFSQSISDFIVIGEEISGGALLLSPISAEIWFLAHDYSTENESLHIGESSSLFRVAHDITQLRTLLLTTEQNDDNDTFGKYWFEDAELRRVKTEKIQEEHRIRKLKNQSKTR